MVHQTQRVGMETLPLLFAIGLLGLISLFPLGESVIWSPSLASHRTTREDLIREYFRNGYTCSMIVKILWLTHGIRLSLRHLKRVLKKLGLQRRVQLTGAVFHQVVASIRMEVLHSGIQLGYRALWHRLRRKYRLPVSRNIVMRTLRRMAPHDSEMRKSHCLQRRRYHNYGPNSVWHCDGMDKLKAYGFAVHGYIDGYSRRILWLEVGVSNNDPAVITRYFLDTVKQLGGAPAVLRCDLGTENATLACVQPFLRRHGRDSFAGENSFRYGRSTSNQRIEAWWSVLRRWLTDWWMEFFRKLKYEGLFNETNPIHVDCLRFSFMRIIEQELHQIAKEWNCHRIRPCHSSDVPGGIPDQLFFAPGLIGAGVRNYLMAVNDQDLLLVGQLAWPTKDPPCSLEFLLAAQKIMQQHNLTMPTNAREALQLYIELVERFEHYAQH